MCVVKRHIAKVMYNRHFSPHVNNAKRFVQTLACAAITDKSVDRPTDRPTTHDRLSYATREISVCSCCIPSRSRLGVLRVIYKLFLKSHARMVLCDSQCILCNFSPRLVFLKKKGAKEDESHTPLGHTRVISQQSHGIAR